MGARGAPGLSGFCLGDTGRWESGKGVRSGYLFFYFLLPVGSLRDTGKVHTEGPEFES